MEKDTKQNADSINSRVLYRSNLPKHLYQILLKRRTYLSWMKYKLKEETQLHKRLKMGFMI